MDPKPPKLIEPWIDVLKIESLGMNKLLTTGALFTALLLALMLSILPEMRRRETRFTELRDQVQAWNYADARLASLPGVLEDPRSALETYDTTAEAYKLRIMARLPEAQKEKQAPHTVIGRMVERVHQLQRDLGLLEGWSAELEDVGGLDRGELLGLIAQVEQPAFRAALLFGKADSPSLTPFVVLVEDTRHVLWAKPSELDEAFRFEGFPESPDRSAYLPYLRGLRAEFDAHPESQAEWKAEIAQLAGALREKHDALLESCSTGRYQRCVEALTGPDPIAGVDGLASLKSSASSDTFVSCTAMREDHAKLLQQGIFQDVLYERAVQLPGGIPMPAFALGIAGLLVPAGIALAVLGGTQRIRRAALAALESVNPDGSAPEEVALTRARVQGQLLVCRLFSPLWFLEWGIAIALPLCAALLGFFFLDISGQDSFLELVYADRGLGSRSTGMFFSWITALATTFATLFALFSTIEAQRKISAHAQFPPEEMRHAKAKH